MNWLSCAQVFNPTLLLIKPGLFSGTSRAMLNYGNVIAQANLNSNSSLLLTSVTLSLKHVLEVILFTPNISITINKEGEIPDIISLTLKLTIMKKIISFRSLMCSILIGLLSTSCSKDSEPYQRTPCDNCGTISSSDLTPLYMTDGNWTRLPTGEFKSDLSMFLHQDGVLAKQVYAIYIVDESGLLQIFPYRNEKYKGGSVYGTVGISDENDECTLTFSFAKEDEHYGELPHGNSLPFQTIDLKIMLLK